MSDEREKKAGKMANDDEMADVEAHKKSHQAADATVETDDVEAHMKAGRSADGTSDDDNDVDAHMKSHGK